MHEYIHVLPAETNEPVQTGPSGGWIPGAKHIVPAAFIAQQPPVQFRFLHPHPLMNTKVPALANQLANPKHAEADSSRIVAPVTMNLLLQNLGSSSMTQRTP